MDEQIMMDGEPLEVGDRVWCMVNGWVKFDTFVNNTYYPVRCSGANGKEYYLYTIDFQQELNTGRILYWDEIKITPPPKPKKKVKVWDWYIEFLDEYLQPKIHKRIGLTELEAKKLIPAKVQKIDGTEREVEI